MAELPRNVQSQLTLRLHVPGGCVEVPATFHYDGADPYAVRVCFKAEAGTVIEWMLARELIAQGMIGMIGDGDVRVWPGPDRAGQVAYLELTSPSGQALFEVPAPELRTFLAHSYAVVPCGQESDVIRLDDELGALLYGDLT